jgi:hypothetical protein
LANGREAQLACEAKSTFAKEIRPPFAMLPLVNTAGRDLLALLARDVQV